MRELLKHLYYDTTVGHLLIYPIKKLYDFFGSYILSENVYIKWTFKNLFGYNLNLDNPKTFNEKIHWLQKNDRTPLKTKCTDKYTVREYVKEKIGEQYLIPLVLHTTNPKDIVPENLPDYPFIIKTNHGSGGYVIVRNKSNVEWKKIQRSLNKLLKRNFYYQAREWQYKDIKPCILVEKLLLDENSNIPNDYKFDCMNGRVKFIDVYIDRNIDYKIKCYDQYWNSLDYNTGIDIRDEIEKPKMLDKMISLAEILASDFRYVRVDTYSFDNEIYFGEMTFSPAAGFDVFDSPKWDRIFGDKLII